MTTLDPTAEPDFATVAAIYIPTLEREGVAKARDAIRIQVEWNENLRGLFLKEYESEWWEERVPAATVMKTLAAMHAGIGRVCPARLLSLNPTHLAYGREAATITSLRLGSFGLVPYYPPDKRDNEQVTSTFFPEVRRPSFDAYLRIASLLNRSTAIARQVTDQNVEVYWLRLDRNELACCAYSTETLENVQISIPSNLEVVTEEEVVGTDLLDRKFPITISENQINVSTLPKKMPVLFHLPTKITEAHTPETIGAENGD